MQTKILSSAVAMLALVQTALAQNTAPVYPTTPIGSTTWSVGSQNTIEWNNSGNSSSYSKVDLILGTGAGNVVNVMGPIATGLPWPATTKYTWTVPASVGGKAITTGKIYTVQFTTYGGTDGSLNSWSTWFTLTSDGKVSSGGSSNSTSTGAYPVYSGAASMALSAAAAVLAPVAAVALL